jgi:hypothetical protein
MAGGPGEDFWQKKRGRCDFSGAGANHSMKGKYVEERKTGKL